MAGPTGTWGSHCFAPEMWVQSPANQESVLLGARLGPRPWQDVPPVPAAKPQKFEVGALGITTSESHFPQELRILIYMKISSLVSLHMCLL